MMLMMMPMMLMMMVTGDFQIHDLVLQSTNLYYQVRLCFTGTSLYYLVRYCATGCHSVLLSIIV